jgi:hypothetical protein
MTNVVHRAIRNAVAKLLKPYLEQHECVSKISIKNGKIEIVDLIASNEAINAVLAAKGLPFEVKLCHCKFAHIEIPWIFRDHSILIRIDELSVVVAPLHESAWSLERVWQQTEAGISLALAALIKKQDKLSQRSGRKRSLFGLLKQQLLAKADPRITIENVHVRYESLVGPEAFVAGLVLEACSIQTDFGGGRTDGTLDLKHAGVYCRTRADAEDRVGTSVLATTSENGVSAFVLETTSPAGTAAAGASAAAAAAPPRDAAGSGTAARVDGSGAEDALAVVQRMREVMRTACAWNDAEWLVGPVFASGTMARRQYSTDATTPLAIAHIKVMPTCARVSDAQLAALVSVSGHRERYKLFSCYAALIPAILHERPSRRARLRWQAAFRAIVRSLGLDAIVKPGLIGYSLKLARRYRQLYTTQLDLAGQSLNADDLIGARARMPDQDRLFMEMVEARIPAVAVALWRLLSRVKGGEKHGGTSTLAARRKALTQLYDNLTVHDLLLFNEAEAEIAGQLTEPSRSVQHVGLPAGYCHTHLAIDCQSICLELSVAAEAPNAPSTGRSLPAMSQGRGLSLLRVDAKPIALRVRKFARTGEETRLCIGDVEIRTGAAPSTGFGAHIARVQGDRGGHFTEEMLGGTDPVLVVAPSTAGRLVQVHEREPTWLNGIQQWTSQIFPALTKSEPPSASDATSASAGVAPDQPPNAPTDAHTPERSVHGGGALQRSSPEGVALVLAFVCSTSELRASEVKLDVALVDAVYSPSFFRLYRRFADRIELATSRYPLSATNSLRTKWGLMTRTVDSALKPIYWWPEVKMMTLFLSLAPLLYGPSPHHGVLISSAGLRLSMANPDAKEPDDAFIMGISLPPITIERLPLTKISETSLAFGGPIELSTPIRGGLFARIVEAATYGQAYTLGTLRARLDEHASARAQLAAFDSATAAAPLMPKLRLDSSLDDFGDQLMGNSVGTQVDMADLLAPRIPGLKSTQRRKQVALLELRQPTTPGGNFLTGCCWANFHGSEVVAAQCTVDEMRPAAAGLHAPLPPPVHMQVERA